MDGTFHVFGYPNTVEASCACLQTICALPALAVPQCYTWGSWCARVLRPYLQTSGRPRVTQHIGRRHLARLRLVAGSLIARVGRA